LQRNPRIKCKIRGSNFPLHLSPHRPIRRPLALTRGEEDFMKTLLVNPEFPDTYWSFRHALPFEGKRSAFPPLGLLTVSALLPRSWERRLVDPNVGPLKTADIEWAHGGFATAMLVQKDSLRQLLERYKARGKHVVIGGRY